MPNVPVPNTVQVTLTHTLNASQAMNTYYFHKGTSWSVGDIDDIIDYMESWWGADGNSLQTAEAKLTFIRAVDLTSLDTRIRTKSMSIDGGSPLPAAPVNSTIAIKFDTGKRGRGRSGRIFYPFPTEDGIDAYTVPAGTITSLVTTFDQIITGAPGAVPGAEWVVVHRQRDNVKLPVGTYDAVIGSAVVDPYLDSMKLRLPNHKRQKRRTPTP